MFVIKDNKIYEVSSVNRIKLPTLYHIKLFDKYNISCGCLLDYYLPKIRKEYPFDKITKWEELSEDSKNFIIGLIQENPELRQIHRESQLNKLLCNHE